MHYLSVCSGIEAATVAWHPLGWTPFGFSEIEPFPCAVLAHHYGSNLPGETWSGNAPPNFGDMTKFEEWPDATIDVFVGGTPCQDYSIAGLRAGMDGIRGSLTLTFAAIARKYRSRWLAWENVPGVLSSNKGRDFGKFLGLLAGRQIEVPAGGWQSAGIVPGYGGAYGLAWRVLDAQYIRVDGFARAAPQRRRRVFVVGYLGDWRRAAAVLFERASLCGNPPPRREAGQGIAADAAPSLVSSGRGVERPGETRGQDPVIAVITSTGDVAHCLNAGGMGRQDYETETMVAHALRAEGFDASEDGTGRGTPLVPISMPGDVAGTLKACGGKSGQPNGAEEADRLIIAPAVAQTLTRGAESAGKGGYAGRRQEDDANIVAIQEGSQDATHPYTLAIRGRGDSHDLEFRQDGTANALLTPNGGRGGIGVGAIATRWAVRRLMPVECERLQGFTDGYTAVPFRNKPAADGPRYKALGNSMAVNVMRWIGQRIAAVDAIEAAE